MKEVAGKHREEGAGQIKPISGLVDASMGG